MTAFFYIVVEVILPVFTIIAIGFWMQKTVKLDLRTLAKLNIHFLVPGIIFVKLYEANFSLQLFGSILLFMSLLFVILLGLTWVTGNLFKNTTKEKKVLSNSVVFYNSGNYGVPVNSLVFKQDPFALSIQVIVLVIQNIFTFTYGIFLMRGASTSRLQAMKEYLRMPIFYALILAIVMNALQIPLPSFIWIPALHISDALIAMALLTLGAQVANLPFTWNDIKVWNSVILRLMISPLIAIGLIFIMKLEGVMAQALLISTAMPTSVNSAIIAQEYGNEPELAARIVLITTVISSLTVSLTIYVALLLY